MQKEDSLIQYLDEINNTVGKRWTFRIILELRKAKTIRYNDLLNLLSGISPSTLSTALKSLQKQNLVKREVSGSIPPFKVEYSLSEKGFSFLIASYPLLKWAVNRS